MEDAIQPIEGPATTIRLGSAGRPRAPWTGAVATTLALACAVPAARADLTDPRILAQLNALETAAARANQASFETLSPACAAGPGPACPPDVFGVFEETRELVHTANELLGTGDTQFSLGLDIDGLGFALRWTAAEELAAQGSMTTEFAASQLSTLSARLAALRWGISGPRLTSLRDADGSIRVARSGALPLGGGASADAERLYSRWSWFLDGAFGYGDKDPTDLEDAFEFDGQEVTFGVDYRFSPALAAGAMIGYSTKEVDFDSSRSIVDGRIKTDGGSVLGYALLEGERAYLTGSLGFQRLSHDSRRRITYPSQNPLIPSVDSLATGDTDSDTLLATLGAGYAFRWGAFSIEPSLGLDYMDARVDGFRESSVDNTADASPDDPFDLQIGEQDIESLDGSAGLQLQYVFTPRFGVLVPYVSGRYHRELLDDARRVSALYADAFNRLIQAIDADFNVPTDPPDEDYYTVAAGATVVLAGGLMGFVQYMQVLDLENYSDAVITGGMRYEFGR
jgi:outer membrane autotransporter protein